MGINACTLNWFESLVEIGAFRGQSSILELGPQDFYFPPETLLELASRRLGREQGLECAQSIQDPSISHKRRQELFYSIFGFETYGSVDVYDQRASFRLDLNTATSTPSKFDVIIDCGTTEHIFNAGNVFIFTHNSLNVGGVSLKLLPTFGDNTHGFYNIHPTVYFDLARENGYEILDFRYVDNMLSRLASRGADSLLSLDELSHGLRSFAGCASLQERITRNFLAILEDANQTGRIAWPHTSVDYCFVAMKKQNDSPFKYPGQGMY